MSSHSNTLIGLKERVHIYIFIQAVFYEKHQLYTGVFMSVYLLIAGRGNIRNGGRGEIRSGRLVRQAPSSSSVRPTSLRVPILLLCSRYIYIYILYRIPRLVLRLVLGTVHNDFQENSPCRSLLPTIIPRNTPLGKPHRKYTHR